VSFMPKLSAVLGKNIKRILDEKGLTQTDFADKMGVSFKTINTYINGKTGVSSGMLEKMASVLDVEETDLVTPSGDKAILEAFQAYAANVRQIESQPKTHPLMTEFIQRLNKLPSRKQDILMNAWMGELEAVIQDDRRKR
jgi:putative transcriptional regulator